MIALLLQYILYAMSKLLSLGIALTTIFTVVLLKNIFTSKRSIASLPPGPPKLPLFQNLLDLPTGKTWITFSEWGKRWGACHLYY